MTSEQSTVCSKAHVFGERVVWLYDLVFVALLRAVYERGSL